MDVAVNRIGWTRLVQSSRGRKAADPGVTGSMWILSTHRDCGAFSGPWQVTGSFNKFDAQAPPWRF